MRLPINYRTEPHPVRYNRKRDERNQIVLDLDAPLKETAVCPDCGTRKETRYFTVVPRPGSGDISPCIDCTRLLLEELTSPAVAGSKGKSDAWKAANLHLYYEHYYAKRCTAAGAPVAIRTFSMQELLNAYAYECSVPRCGKRWRDLRYLMAPEDGGSHSLENVRPVCLGHAGDGAL